MIERLRNGITKMKENKMKVGVYSPVFDPRGRRLFHPNIKEYMRLLLNSEKENIKEFYSSVKEGRIRDGMGFLSDTIGNAIFLLGFPVNFLIGVYEQIRGLERVSDDFVLSKKAREKKIPVYEVTDVRPVRMPRLYGRVRPSGFQTLTEYLARGRRTRRPYKDTEYTSALIEYNQDGYYENIKNEINELKSFLKEVDIELYEKIKNISGLLKNEDEYYVQSGNRRRRVGVIALSDGGNYREALNYKIEADKSEVVSIHDKLIKPYKSQGFYATQIGKAVKRMCKTVREKGENIRRMVRLAKNDETGYAPDVKEWVRKECEKIYEDIDLIERFLENTQKGLYLTDPPLHVGRRGEDAPEFEVRSYSLLDYMFHEIKRNDGKKEYVNVNEFIVGETAVRFYRFSSKPEPNYLGDNGYAIEIVNGRESRFLDEKEAKEFVKNLKDYTLFTIIEKYR